MDTAETDMDVAALLRERDDLRAEVARLKDEAVQMDRDNGTYAHDNYLLRQERDAAYERISLLQDEIRILERSADEWRQQARGVVPGLSRDYAKAEVA